MSAEVKFLRPTRELVEAIAADMRQADADEVWASNRHAPIQALMRGWEMSDFTVIATVDDTPCVMLGLVKHDILTGAGIPWLLGTETALKYKRHFLTQVPAVIGEMLRICPRLFNYVHVDNIVSIQWLRRIGFTINEAEPLGCGGEMFHKFHIERMN